VPGHPEIDERPSGLRLQIRGNGVTIGDAVAEGGAAAKEPCRAIQRRGFDAVRANPFRADVDETRLQLLGYVADDRLVAPASADGVAPEFVDVVARQRGVGLARRLGHRVVP